MKRDIIKRENDHFLELVLVLVALIALRIVFGPEMGP